MTWGPVAPADPSALAAIGDRLRQLGFIDDPRSAPSVHRISLPSSTDGGEVDAALALLGRGSPCEERRAVDLLGPEGVDVLVASGFLVRSGGEVQASGRLVVWEGLLLVGDADQPTYEGHATVVPMSGTTQVLDRLRLDRRVAHAVDLGCGSGALALRLAAQAEHVTAIDINPRSVALTRINAALNGCDNIEAVEGSLLDPLGDQRVDLVLGNLPFVLSPDRGLLFRDGDRPTDELVRDAVTGASAHLADGGVAQFLCNWPVDGDDPDRGPRALTAPVDDDVIAIQYVERSAFDHVRHWNPGLEDIDPDRFGETVDRWVAWFEERQVSAVAFGTLTIRRPSAPGRPATTVVHRAAHSPGVGGGQQLERMLTAIEAPAALDAEAVVPTLAPHSLVQVLEHDGVGYEASPAEVVPTASAGVIATVPGPVVPTLFAVDGERSVAALVGDEPAVREVLVDLWNRGLLELAPA